MAAVAPAPGWHTDELVEEWVETSQVISPQLATADLPEPVTQRADQASIRAKRGSLRMLGHASARGLPPRVSNAAGTQSSTLASKRAVSSVSVISEHGLPSPPESRTSSGSGGEHEEVVAGTFVVKEGVEDDRGKNLARKPFMAGKGGKDIFGPSPLERMFEPPSPPQPQTADDSPQQPSEPRRASHQYAPANPSRLSKSITPSNVSSLSIQPSELPSPDQTQPMHDEDSVFVEQRSPESDPEPKAEQSTGRLGEMTLKSGEVETDLSPFAKPGPSNYPFTFNAPVRVTSTSSGTGTGTGSGSATIRGGSTRSRGIFEPPLGPFDDGEPSHSTIHERQPTKRSAIPAQLSRSTASQNPALRLFRSTYDTYTREHLSAIVDSIAIEPSPSPPSLVNAHNLRDWSPPASNSVSPGSGSPFDSGSGSSLSELRSSKRLRLSPVSPRRQPRAMRDWGAQGRAMMDRIKDLAEDSTTSASQSRSQTATASEQPDGESFGYLCEGSTNVAEPEPYEDFATLPPSPPLVTRSRPQEKSKANHRSNPSTASSGYLRAAEDLMARIKNRVVSDSTGIETSPANGRRALSETTEQAVTASNSEAERRFLAIDKGKGKAKVGPSPRRMLRRLSASEEVRKAAEDESEEDVQVAIKRDSLRGRLQEERRPTSAGSNPSSGSAPQANFNRDDLNRFMSSSTVATGTTISTSFVKHRGPRAAAGMRVIRPDEVQDVLQGQVGKMRYDKATMRWVRELPMVDEAGESRAGGSEESVDVFAGIGSWRDGSAPPPEPAIPQQPSDTSEDDMRVESPVQMQEANVDSDTSESDDDLIAPHAQTSPEQHTAPRPPIHHADSAPPALQTPAPGSGLKPIRSALRNPNSLTPGPKKRAGWHDDLTPANRPDLASTLKRSVSFSDSKQSARPANTFNGPDTVADEGKSFQPSTRTKRIQEMLEDMQELSMEENASPSKTAREPRPILQPHDDDSETTIPARSFRQRAAANATFLTECSFGVAHDRLVQLITDVEPFEPYWEELKEIDLSNKATDSVARLKEFLPALEHIRLDDNLLTYLSGIPGGVKELWVAGNRLTSLTSVNHLNNLRFLDVSRNQLDSLNQFSCLTHLRELRANGNNIRDISGIMSIESLRTVSLAGNKISSVDFAQAVWSKLDTLDLSANALTTLNGLHHLAAMSTLNLDNNDLRTLRLDEGLAKLQVLKISHNSIASLDVSFLPALRQLHADGNKLSHLSRTSTDRVCLIDSLSLRSQRLPASSRLHLSGHDWQPVRRLYVSGNALSDDFFPLAPLENLVYLEMAACRLSSWPRRFARRLPNLEVLNANYNFFEDLSGLESLSGLRKVSAVGCRLGGSAKGAVKALRGLSKLEHVDLRMNPSTLGFYLPLMLSTGEPEAPAAKSKPVPNATAILIGQPANKSLAMSMSSQEKAEDWALRDVAFRRTLPDEWYGRRLIYRGLVMAALPKLQSLDGLKIEDGEKRKARELIARAAATA